MAVVSCRSKHRWKDICAFRVFPYKFQTSLQFFDLVDDYIQSEINKPTFRPTCTVLLLYEFLFNISFIMLTHLILPTHLKDKHALLFTLRLTCYIVFLFPSTKVLYGLSMGDAKVLIFPFCLNNQGVADLFYIILF